MGKYMLSHTFDGGIQRGKIMHSRRIRIPPGSEYRISNTTAHLAYRRRTTSTSVASPTSAWMTRACRRCGNEEIAKAPWSHWCNVAGEAILLILCSIDRAKEEEEEEEDVSAAT